jgi:hypothetical protein
MVGNFSLITFTITAVACRQIHEKTDYFAPEPRISLIALKLLKVCLRNME